MDILQISIVKKGSACCRLARLAALGVAACGPGDDPYTLYRSSAIKEHMRIHVATFDADAGRHYNMDNCEIARGLFQAQPGVTVRYWCEKGRYRP